eukprot:3563187-Rhodomonas_salina.1
MCIRDRDCAGREARKGTAANFNVAKRVGALTAFSVQVIDRGIARTADSIPIECDSSREILTFESRAATVGLGSDSDCYVLASLKGSGSEVT